MQMYMRTGVQAGMWIACLLGEVAHMHVGAGSFLFSPNMAVKRGACLWGCRSLWTNPVWDCRKVTVFGGGILEGARWRKVPQYIGEPVGMRRTEEVCSGVDGHPWHMCACVHERRLCVGVYMLASGWIHMGEWVFLGCCHDLSLTPCLSPSSWA